MHLKNLANTLNRPLVIPLMGYPGIQLTHSTIKQNEFNWGLHFWTIHELAQRFQPDAIFFMMDLAVEANALGLPVRFPLDESPTVEYPLVKQLTDLYQFLSLDPLKDGRVMAFIETMKLMKQVIDIPKGAYVIGPFTLAGLLMGANEVALATILEPGLVIGVLEFCTSVINRYAQALVAAGADIVAILEPTAVMLSPDAFWKFSGQFIKRIIEQIPVIPVLHICGNTTHLIPSMVQTGAQGLSLDAMVNFPKVIQTVPETVFLIGNIDPVRVMLRGTPQQVREETSRLLEQMRPYPNFILSTGCDLPPETPLENIEAFMEVGKNWTR
ncbi:MAG: uroporphyrinogen decarboxylase family protein [candidate division KSB1 bacterium]|nr:uroporphyrinogen decarboxylase family protein [candidate division KSB1 bacterium]